MIRFTAGRRIVCYLLLGIALAGTLVSGIAAFRFWLFLKLPGSPVREVHELNVRPGMNAVAIARLLQSQGVIADARKFYLLAWLHKSSHKLQAGEYAFSTLSTPGQILDQLVQGKVLLHRVTFPEGSTVRDVAGILENHNLARKETVLQLAEDGEFIGSLDLDVPSLEGYLFPETYYFSRTQSTASILKTMVHQFRLHFPESWEKRAEQLGFSVNETVTLASMVEKEAVVDLERPLIAAVFLNRLKRNMPLQSDPTAVYDLPDFAGPITRSHLERTSPYNTYQRKGLPAGPICNPGVKSMEAVLFPVSVPYLYFVSNNDGTHHFSTTIEEHSRAVSRYRKKLKSREQ